MSLVRLLLSEQYVEVAQHIEKRLYVQVDPDKLRQECGLAIINGSVPDKRWPDDDCMMWLKNRLANMALLDPGKQMPAPVELKVPLHVFFISLEETPEMLERLGTDLFDILSQVATSRVTSSLIRLKPINRVAARVAPVDQDSELQDVPVDHRTDQGEVPEAGESPPVA